MTLTDDVIAAALPAAKPYKLTDSGGLFLLVNPNGSKYWRLRYRLGAKENQLSLGVYPQVSIDMARQGRDEAKVLLVRKVDPSTVRKEGKARHLAETLLPTPWRVVINQGGQLEIWRGETALMMTREEAREVYFLLGKLLTN